MKNEKGITLLALIVTVILMAILAAATINYGINSLNTMRLQNFNYELQQIQGKVDTIYEKIKLGNEDYVILGHNLTYSTDAVNLLSGLKGIDYSNKAGMTDSQKEKYYFSYGGSSYTCYRYLTQSDLESLLDITSDIGDVIINFTTREVISVEGFYFDGVTYYVATDK